LIKVTFVESSGKSHEVDAQSEESVMRAAVNNAVPGIVADCGGALSCATCHVYVRCESEHLLVAATPEETAMLEMAIDPTPRSRLSCCIKITPEIDGLIVDIPERQF
jgi:ferredoxin, 2Fe-2S